MEADKRLPVQTPTPAETPLSISPRSISSSTLSSRGSSSSPASPIRTTKKNRCALSGCSDRVGKIVGHCRHCSQDFCSKHRLAEAHNCSQLESCRQASFDKNASKLLEGKCVASKV
ncbi:uncharacterized protein BJ171DRAFT_444576 [Polychytrium aggregatum]|uniref:uncharacterized protein n=1 Tax=Polychytrium aggregatum TaxID=110093 RepID=UPI0022FE37B4|nr:uncharacterized protein BJ171DRAFT_444576 [Polychytrium aggregatum]KAI9202340.1 hypothetical protein BJ171DRAFT_444576 [Polychytrium aggregatum]